MSRTILYGGRIFDGTGSPIAGSGTLEPGKRADLVVTAGDPFDFGRLKENIRAVYSGGRLVRGSL